MTCKGKCIKYKTPRVAGTGHYRNGHKRCQICEIFIKHDGLWCPCCGYRLRTKPRNLKYKAKLHEKLPSQKPELLRTNLDSPANPHEGKWLHDCPVAKMIISNYGTTCPQCQIPKEAAIA